MVDPQEEGASSSKSLVERLEEAPKKILDYLSSTTKNYIAHLLGIVKSYWPRHDLAPIALGIASECPNAYFLRYREEAEPIAEEIIKNFWQTDLLVIALRSVKNICYRCIILIFCPVDICIRGVAARNGRLQYYSIACLLCA